MRNEHPPLELAKPRQLGIGVRDGAVGHQGGEPDRHAHQESESQEQTRDRIANVIEEMFKVASTREWYKEKGRHKVYAAGRSVPLPVLNGNGNGSGAQIPTFTVKGDRDEKAAPAPPPN